MQAMQQQRESMLPPARHCHPMGPYSRRMPRALWWSYGGVAVSYERGTHLLQAMQQQREAMLPPARRAILAARRAQEAFRMKNNNLAIKFNQYANLTSML